jgi:hypothetical protein
VIVNQTQKGWEIIFQSAHALLAAKIGSYLKEMLPSDYTVDTLLAIAHHDDLQVGVERGNYLTERGAPQDFSMLAINDDQRREQVEKILSESYKKSRWVGLLISRHYHFLYSREELNESFKKLIDQETRRRKAILKEMSLTGKELDQAYGYMRWCDRCSLILCQSRLPALERKLEVNDGLGDGPSYIFQREEGTIGITPWCFDREGFEVGVEVYELEQISYASNAKLEKDLETTVPTYKRWKFVK